MVVKLVEFILTLGEKPVGVRDSERSPHAESPYKSREDRELDAFFVAFKHTVLRGTDIGMHSKGDMKKKLKHRKKKLVAEQVAVCFLRKLLSQYGFTRRSSLSWLVLVKVPVGALWSILTHVGTASVSMDMFSGIFFYMWKDASVSVLSRSHLDYCPIMLKVACSNYGPKPFQVFNKWIGEDNFNELVSNSWAGFQSNLRPDLCLMNKLKSIDVIDEILEEDFDALLDEGSEILHSIEGTILEEKLFAEFDEFMAMTADENTESESDTEEPPFEKITFNIDYKIKTSLEEPPTDLELNLLPDNLEYVFLEEPSFLPVIISSQLSEKNKNKLVYVLKRHKQAFAWKTIDIPRICPSFCKHKIQLLEDKKPFVQKQRRLNPNMQEVVKKK
ncbi:hypothetical protein Tco_0226346 [Tanacetum coccineum]